MMKSERRKKKTQQVKDSKKYPETKKKGKKIHWAECR